MNDTSSVTLDPLQTGLRLGAAGAAAGLGIAAIHKAVRERHGHKHVSVLKPMLAGAAIGAALGGGMALQSWRSKRMNQPATKYAALCRLVEKRAVLDSYARFGEEHPFLNTGAYLLPGVGSAMAAADTVRSASEGRWLAAAGNAAMIPMGLIGLGGIAKALPRMALAARLASKGGPAKSMGHYLRTAEQGLSGKRPKLGLWERTWQGVGTDLFNRPLRNMPVMSTANRWAQRGQQLENRLGVGHKFKSLQGIPGLNRLTGAGATTLGSVGLLTADTLRSAPTQPQGSGYQGEYAPPGEYRY